jgi:hypothetical protein
MRTGLANGLRSAKMIERDGDFNRPAAGWAFGE